MTLLKKDTFYIVRYAFRLNCDLPKQQLQTLTFFQELTGEKNLSKIKSN